MLAVLRALVAKAAFFVVTTWHLHERQRNGATVQELAWVLARSLAYVVSSIIEAIASRNCVRRKSALHLRLGDWFELRSTKAEEFDRIR
ncbi:hypothetical protein [uncultured Sphingopyxis sp.]|jgi:hypothetical protein|uniref:hypothetical protein n=1 Tax=uncultured Sphingopyxis sp. TaxID=310581 RepID=UPI000AE9A593|nr:hypothetical protein [uncultured Sphingopyxis sp.]KAB2851937.1 MAG: hypothetical protein F9K41_15535 [Sphingopyxis terrae]